MRNVPKPETLPLIPEHELRRELNVGTTCWRKYRQLGIVRTVELFNRFYVTPEERARLLKEGTRRPGRKPMEAAE